MTTEDTKQAHGGALSIGNEFETYLLNKKAEQQDDDIPDYLVGLSADECEELSALCRSMDDEQ